MHIARDRFQRDAAVRPLTADLLDSAGLHAFLIYFSAFGTRMTEPVEGWIRTAGDRCRAVGFQALGDAFHRHARHEANHHLMMIDDTRLLVQQWNETYRARLDANALLDSEPSGGVHRYWKVHEDVIASDA